MKIVVAPQGFKGSVDAPEVASCIVRGIRVVFPHAHVVVLPVADGGEGTVRALVQATGGKTITTRVHGPLERPVNATWGVLGQNEVGIVEMAAASGLPLIRRDERNPMRTTTYGTGELIRHALDLGIRKLIIGIGGSATNDGGTGMARALGVRFLDRDGRDLPAGGGALHRLERIDASGLDPRVAELEVSVASDVNNPLCGETGASAVYGPQKGADATMVRLLDEGLAHYADVLARDVGKDVRDVPGSGAAGGLGAGLMAFLGARLESGVGIVFKALHLEEHVRGADLVFTGEGRIDSQDLYGKAPMAVAGLAHRHGVPCIAVVGSTGRDYHVVYSHGMDAVIGTTNRPMSLERAVAESPRLISEAAMRACRLVQVGLRMTQKVDGAEDMRTTR